MLLETASGVQLTRIGALFSAGNGRPTATGLQGHAGGEGGLDTLGLPLKTR